MIPASTIFDQSTLTQLLNHDPLVADYRAFFSLLDWSLVDPTTDGKAGRGRPAHPESAYLKAFLIRIKEGLTYTTQVRDYLLKHPLLIIELGFHLHLDPNAAYGFDPEQTLPCRFWFGQKLRHLDRTRLQSLLAATVNDLQDAIPGLGEVVAFDVKHIYAWVKENNPRAFVKERYDKAQRLAGDPDCRLGVKRSTNRHPASVPDPSFSSEIPSGEPGAAPAPSDPKADKKEKKELLWGYGSGVAAATSPDYGDIVLAEYTQPFNEGDITYFRPLSERALAAVSSPPTHLTADAAFDAWYVYQQAVELGGIAAVPLNGHGHPDRQRDHDAVPICRKGLRMVPVLQYAHPNGYRAQRFGCPLLLPQATGETCDHPQFLKGKGCCKDPNWEEGGRMRVLLDRESPLYKAVYVQRTSCERINSQAKELGIERPKVRNARSVANLNTLIYLVINGRALQKAKSINRRLLQMN